MKTLVRVQEYRKSSDNIYIIKSIQILTNKVKGYDSLEPIGTITFQQTIGEDRWYGMRFNIDTDNVGYIKKMSRLAGFIEKNSNWDSQPDEILKVIGAVEYKIFNHEFVPVSKEGEYLWDVIQHPGSLHSRIIAPNEKIAKRLLKKKPEGTTLKYNRKIIF